MRIASLIIGIFGAIAGFIGALLAMLVGGIGVALDESEGNQIVVLGMVALLMSIVGLVGAALAMAKPRAAAMLMALSAIVGIVVIFLAYIVAMVLLLIAAALAFLGRNEKRGGGHAAGTPMG